MSAHGPFSLLEQAATRVTTNHAARTWPPPRPGKVAHPRPTVTAHACRVADASGPWANARRAGGGGQGGAGFTTEARRHGGGSELLFGGFGVGEGVGGVVHPHPL